MIRTLGEVLGKHLSPLAFGVMQFGGKADAASSRDLYDQARAAGITIFDAAFIYNDGASETLLGQFAEHERDKLVLISKCAYAPGMRGDQIKAQIAESRDRLRTGCIDIVYLQRYPGDDLLDETLEAVGEMHGAGAFTVLGVSNFAAWQVMKAQARAADLGAPPIRIVQPMYNLVKRQAEVEILPMTLAEGLAVHAYSPLGGGLLTGKYDGGETGRLSEDDRYAARYGQDWMHTAARGLSQIADDLGIPPAALAIAWAARHPGISAPIISASRPDQLAASLASLEVDMTDALYQRLSDLTPTPPPATDRTEEG